MKNFNWFGGWRKIFWVIFLMLGFPYWVRSEIVDEVVAIVNDDVITRSELIRVAQVNRPAEGQDQAAYFQQVLARLIDQKLIDQATKGMEIKVSEEDVDRMIKGFKEYNQITDEQLEEGLRQQNLTWEEYRSQIREEIRRNQVIGQKLRTKIGVTEKEIKAYYKKNTNDFFDPAQVKIEQMQFIFPNEATQAEKDTLAQKAEASMQRAVSGESFEKIIQELNLPLEQAAYEVGVFKKGELTDVFDQRAFSLPIGEASGVIATSKGCFIIRVLERTEEKTRTLEEVQKTIENILLEQKMEGAFQEWIKELRGNAYIDVKI